jgi:hypothetical protein
MLALLSSSSERAIGLLLAREEGDLLLDPRLRRSENQVLPGR